MDDNCVNAGMPGAPGATQSRVVNSTSGSPSPAPGAPSATPGGVASVGVPGTPGYASAGPAGATAGPVQATPSQATTPGATAAPAGATTTPPAPPAPAQSGPPGSLVQGLGPAVKAPPASSSGVPGSLAGFPTVPQQLDPQSALEFAKHVQSWAKGHQAAAALRDRFGANFPTPGATAQPGASGAPGEGAFSPSVNSMLSRLRAQGWSNTQVPGVGHVIRHQQSGKAFVFHPENGKLTPFNSTPSLAGG